MNQDRENLSENESLEIITEMIKVAQGNVINSSFHFLLWGWVILTCNLGQFILQEIIHFEVPYMIWLICIPASIVSSMYGRKAYNKIPAKSHLNKIYQYIWISFLISLIILLVFFANAKGQLILNPVILIFVAFATFLSGMVLKFKPLLIGGILFWVFSVISLIIYNEYQLLISALAILTGYLIPGYMLKRTNR